MDFDDEGIKTLCSSVRKPGGLVDDPNDPNCQVMDPGFNIPVICEKRLKWAAYGAKIYTMIGRPISHDALNRDRLKEFEKHFILLEEHEDPVKLPIVSKTFGIIKAMDLVPSHLRDRLGSCKVPLSYIIRDSVQPPVLQQLQEGSCDGLNYESLSEELIERAPHVGSEYVEDNTKVFQIL